MIIVLVGAPGAGKGTQAEHLVSQFGMVHLSSGDLLRDERKRGTELGKLADSYISAGILVPDDVVIKMILSKMHQLADQDIILDGFPRTVAQAEALDAALDAEGNRINVVPYINVQQAVLRDRLGGRLTCRTDNSHVYNIKYNPPLVPGQCDIDDGELYQREDDKPEKIATRLETYFAQTMPVIEYYRAKGLLREIDGEQDIAAVWQDLLAALGRQEQAA